MILPGLPFLPFCSLSLWPSSWPLLPVSFSGSFLKGEKMIELRKLLVLMLAKLKVYPRAFREILYGMTVHEIDLVLKKERSNLDRLFMLVVFGDLVGLPLLPPHYSMRLLPYIIPSIEKWKRGLLREKDLTDLASMDI